MSAHIHTYTQTYSKCTYERTRACLERRRGSERARSCCRRKKLFTSLSFDAIKPHFAPPKQGLHCTHFLKHQYPSTPHPLFPTYPRTVRGSRASAVLLFYTDQTNRAQSSELEQIELQAKLLNYFLGSNKSNINQNYWEAPHSFTMAPCVVVERLEGKQRCSRAAVGDHAGIQAREWLRWLFTEKRKVNGKTTKPCYSPSHNHDRAAPRQHPLICTGVGPIHPVHGQPMSLATKAMPRNEVTFSPFLRSSFP